MPDAKQSVASEAAGRTASWTSIVRYSSRTQPLALCRAALWPWHRLSQGLPVSSRAGELKAAFISNVMWFTEWPNEVSQ